MTCLGPALAPVYGSASGTDDECTDNLKYMVALLGLGYWKLMTCLDPALAPLHGSASGSGTDECTDNLEVLLHVLVLLN